MLAQACCAAPEPYHFYDLFVSFHSMYCACTSFNRVPLLCRPQRVLKQRLLGARAAPKRVRFAPPMAAIIPGDTVVEQVFTTGIQNFL
jgi:hypothetical protein